MSEAPKLPIPEYSPEEFVRQFVTVFNKSLAKRFAQQGGKYRHAQIDAFLTTVAKNMAWEKTAITDFMKLYKRRLWNEMGEGQARFFIDCLNETVLDQTNEKVALVVEITMYDGDGIPSNFLLNKNFAKDLWTVQEGKIETKIDSLTKPEKEEESGGVPA